jgi:hypothetical protein
MKKLRWGIALLRAVIAFPVSFAISNIAYISWASKTYPHHDSMAGFAAFIDGFPVGLAASVVTFVAALVLMAARSGHGKKARLDP